MYLGSYGTMHYYISLGSTVLKYFIEETRNGIYINMASAYAVV
jgi:hypothetical protein